MFLCDYILIGIIVLLLITSVQLELKAQDCGGHLKFCNPSKIEDPILKERNFTQNKQMSILME
ncbi:hypothetical protein M758_11G073500 [Ceratodon purpureus]|nr:hypothetical protein M758_11G073500 [Ceratodon purpureus]